MNENDALQALSLAPGDLIGACCFGGEVAPDLFVVGVALRDLTCFFCTEAQVPDRERLLT